jgi:hypothetical protein
MLFNTGKVTDIVRTRNGTARQELHAFVTTALSASFAPVPAIHRENRREHLADRK